MSIEFTDILRQFSEEGRYMICPKCKKSDPQNREMCPDCGAPVKPIPEPPGGKIRFGGYDWYVLEKQDGKTLIRMNSCHG